MKRLLVSLLAGVVLGQISGLASADDSVLKFRTMVGISGPFLGTANPIRGVNGGGRPWVLDSGRGELSDDGELKVKVKGLIIPASEGPQFGINPVAFFRATVSCLTIRDGMAVTENVQTENGDEVMKGDPTNGDAVIEADLDLPDPCIAPIVFVTSPTGAWFAATGVGTW